MMHNWKKYVSAFALAFLFASNGFAASLSNENQKEEDGNPLLKDTEYRNPSSSYHKKNLKTPMRGVYLEAADSPDYRDSFRIGFKDRSDRY